MRSSARISGILGSVALAGVILTGCSSSDSAPVDSPSGAPSTEASAPANTTKPASNPNTENVGQGEEVTASEWIAWVNERKNALDKDLSAGSYSIVAKSTYTSNGSKQEASDDLSVNSDGSRKGISYQNGDGVETICPASDECWGRYLDDPEDTLWHAYPESALGDVPSPLAEDFQEDDALAAKYYINGDEGSWVADDEVSHISQIITFTPDSVMIYSLSEMSNDAMTDPSVANGAEIPAVNATAEDSYSVEKIPSFTVTRPADSEIGEPLTEANFQ